MIFFDKTLRQVYYKRFKKELEKETKDYNDLFWKLKEANGKLERIGSEQLAFQEVNDFVQQGSLLLGFHRLEKLNDKLIYFLYSNKSYEKEFEHPFILNEYSEEEFSVYGYIPGFDDWIFRLEGKYLVNNGVKEMEIEKIDTGFYSHRGVGTLGMQHLIRIAKDRGVGRIYGVIQLFRDQEDQEALKNFYRKFNFKIKPGKYSIIDSFERILDVDYVPKYTIDNTISRM